MIGFICKLASFLLLTCFYLLFPGQFFCCSTCFSTVEDIKQPENKRIIIANYCRLCFVVHGHWHTQTSNQISSKCLIHSISKVLITESRKRLLKAGFVETCSKQRSLDAFTKWPNQWQPTVGKKSRKSSSCIQSSTVQWSQFIRAGNPINVTSFGLLCFHTALLRVNKPCG